MGLLPPASLHSPSGSGSLLPEGECSGSSSPQRGLERRAYPQRGLERRAYPQRGLERRAYPQRGLERFCDIFLFKRKSELIQFKRGVKQRH